MVIAFGIEEALAQVFGIRVAAWHFADAVKGIVKGGELGVRLSKGELAGVSKTGDLAGLGEEGAHLSAKPQVGRGLLGFG